MSLGLVQHALAAQGRVWGGTHNLVVPTGWEIADDDLFWRLVDRFDPDLVALHLPTYADVEEIAPRRYTEAIDRANQELRRLGFDDQTRTREIERLRNEVLWGLELSAALRSKLVERIAPLQLASDDPRSVFVDGTKPPSYPLTDVAALRELPRTVLDVRSTLDDVDQLMLTHAVGRLLPSFKSTLMDRGVTTNDVLIEHQTLLFDHLWPRGQVVSDFGYPRLLTELGLARRLSIANRDRVVVVVGDGPRDFLLYQGLSRLRPHVYWLPAARLNNPVFLERLAQAVWHAVRTEVGSGDSSTSKSSDRRRRSRAWQLSSSASWSASPFRWCSTGCVANASKPRLASAAWPRKGATDRRSSLVRSLGQSPRRRSS